MHAHFDPTNPFLRMPSVNTLAHIQNVYKIIHNIVGWFTTYMPINYSISI